MYGWIWRSLPGPFLVKALQSLVLLVLALAVLFFWVFPWVENRLPYNDVTVPGPSATATPGPSSGPTSAPPQLPAG